jgi:predicted negative regulator of RcsB-dependent stress response
MKLNLSNENMFLLALSTCLLVVVLLFSFLILLPKEKEYRTQVSQLQTASLKFQKYKKIKDKRLVSLKKLQSDNRYTISGLQKDFTLVKFKNEIQKYFKDATLLKKADLSKKYDNFNVYEVNLSSHIQSPKIFYDFIESIDKDGWVVEITHPIKFKKDTKDINISFGMRIYTAR